MAHAQRLLPLEQLLSEAAGGSGTGQGRAAPARTSSPSMAPDRRGLAESSRPAQVSPFAADSARKTYKTEMSADVGSGPRLVSGASSAPVIMGSAAPEQNHVEPAVAVPELPSPPLASAAPMESASGIEEIRTAVLDALQSAHPMAASLLSGGIWKLEGSQPLVQVAASEAVIKMTLGPDPLRTANVAASNAAGRPVKLKVTSGGSANGSRSAGATPRTINGSGRGRAAEDPIVRRMQEKFGAEIRTIIDLREKK